MSLCYRGVVGIQTVKLVEKEMGYVRKTGDQ